MKWPTLNLTLARRRYLEMFSSREFAPIVLTADHVWLREELLKEIPPFRSKESSGAGAYDISSGLALYRILGSASLDVRTAADDGLWRFLSIKVVPDLVAQRWAHFPEERFFRGRSRIWLRTIWWMIHLTWQGSEAQTRAVLEGVTSDTIVQLIERPGRAGFRIELTRALFMERSLRNPSQEQFRAIMKLNTARVLVIEPTLAEGGAAGYVQSLFSDAGCPDIRNDLIKEMAP